MKITKEAVEHVAQLARLGITEEEKEEFAKDLSSILEYIDKLNRVNTEGVEPTAHILPIHNVFREDAVKPSLSIEEALMNAPDREDRFIKVPAILDSE